MNLTEPLCGTDLGLMRSKAVKQADGTYKFTGTKIFISGGEQDLTENTSTSCWRASKARPPVIKGVSLFVVPKMKLNADGLVRRAERRDLRLDRAQDGHPRLIPPAC